MRLLLLTIVTMGGLALVLEFVLVDTARIAQGAHHEPVEITFGGLPGSHRPEGRGPVSSTRRPASSGEDEARAAKLWWSQRRSRDVVGRRAILRTIVALDSSYRCPAERALKDVERAIRAAAVGKLEGRR